MLGVLAILGARGLRHQSAHQNSHVWWDSRLSAGDKEGALNPGAPLHRLHGTAAYTHARACIEVCPHVRVLALRVVCITCASVWPCSMMLCLQAVCRLCTHMQVHLIFEYNHVCI